MESSTYDRFVDPAAQADPAAFLLQLRAGLACAFSGACLRDGESAA
jgi:hypothetical protein